MSLAEIDINTQSTDGEWPLCRLACYGNFGLGSPAGPRWSVQAGFEDEELMADVRGSYS